MPPFSRSTSNANSNSNLHTSVTFTSPAIYAGEEIECIITFRNVARPKREKTEGKERGAGNDGLRSGTSTRTHSRMPSVAASRVSSKGGVVARGGHNKSASMNVVVSGSSQAGTHSRTASVTPMGPPLLPGTNAARSGKPAGGHAHGRSLSIISMNSEGRLPIHTSKSTSLLQSPTQQRPGRSHTRSASLQYPPSRSPTNQGLQPAPRNPSPLYEATTPPALAETSQSIRPNRRRPGTMSAGNTPQIGTRPAAGGRKVSNGGGEGMNSFRFPADSTNPTAISETESRPKPVRTPSTMHSGQNRSYSPPWAGGVPQSAVNPLTRVMSANSQDGTPRTSSEFYSMSNHSDETLFSEIATPQNYHGQQQQGRLLPKNTATHSQQLSRSLSTRKTFSSEPQTLMMAYVQTMGHFTLDGSLVNTAPFEEVKRKGVQGGGGVVGVERSKRSSGLFGALSWGNIGESLGGLLGGDEMSSMAQMKASIGSKTIPLLSTPQSLLFVDLRLAPGESKSFSYRFVLPRGLPPTHKGRAMKVSYFLSLGVQRPEGQQVKTLEIPFRMLGSYDSRGDTLGHDLMSPYVLLRDAARTQALKPDAVTPNGRPTPEAQRKLKAAATKKSRSPQQGLEDFLRYTERLLDTPSDIHGALLSPTSPSSNSGIPSSFPPLSRQSSSADATPSTIREAIDLAILRSNFATTTSSPSPSSSPASSSERQPTTPAAAANRFNISRNTHPVAVLTLLRPAYRLGESVLGTLDFTALPSAQTCYAINLTLESSEIIDSSLALRSPASVLRATRKIHAAQSVNTLFSRRVAFSLAVPADVAPGFETSGVGVRWRVRVEFVVGREQVRVEEEEEGGGDDEDDGDDHELWETVGKDERGVVRIARERLGAEEFGIEVPIRVLGAVGVEAGNGEGGGFVG